jgi:hypothetical protein
MKVHPGAPPRPRQAWDRGVRALKGGLALFRIHWRDIVFTLLVVAGVALYLTRPERTAQWASTAHWWDALFRYQGVEENATRFEGEPVLRPPADWSESGLSALATFGRDLDYLGADSAVTWGADGAVHLWLLTYWHCPAAACAYQVRYTWGRSGPGMGLAVHDLAQPTIARSGDYVVDHLLLPETAVEGAVAVQVEGEGAPLEVISPLLQIEGGTRLYIWQK